MSRNPRHNRCVVRCILCLEWSSLYALSSTSCIHTNPRPSTNSLPLYQHFLHFGLFPKSPTLLLHFFTFLIQPLHSLAQLCTASHSLYCPIIVNGLLSTKTSIEYIGWRVFNQSTNTIKQPVTLCLNIPFLGLACIRLYCNSKLPITCSLLLPLTMLYHFQQVSTILI